MSIEEKMKEDWNERAKRNSKKYVALGNWKTKEEFLKSGLIDANIIMGDVKTTNTWVVLEVGVGVGRIIRHLTSHFKEIYGVDISEEMIKIASSELEEYRNIKILRNNGCDLAFFPDNTFHFVYSMAVFQHLPKRIFLGYLDEIHRVLKPNSILKFHIFEKTRIFRLIPWFWLRNLRNFHLAFWREPPDTDTWIARSYSREEISMILKKKFELLKMENNSGAEGSLWVSAKAKK